VGWIWEAWVDCSGGLVGGGLRLVKEASVDGGGLDRNAWVEEVGGGGLEELDGGVGRAIWSRKGSSDSHLSALTERIEQNRTARTAQDDSGVKFTH
jgi:hypothetical protein